MQEEDNMDLSSVIPFGKEKDPAELKKDMEFSTERTEAMEHLISMKEQDFKNTPEGREAAFLKDVLEHYIDNDDNFLAHFVSGQPGQRGVDRLISGLEHPESEIKPDEKLLKKLRSLADDMKKKKMPDAEEVHFFRELAKRLKEIGHSSDHAGFVRDFEALVGEVSRYPDTEIAKQVKKFSGKDLPKTVRMNNWVRIIRLWDYIGLRLTEGKKLPPKMEEFEHTFPHTLEGIGSVKEFREKTGLVSDPEDKEWTNWKNLQKELKSKGKKHPLVRLLDEVGQQSQAEDILIEGAKKGRNYVLNQLDMFNRKINSEDALKKVQAAAVGEMVGKIESMLAGFKKEIEKERQKFDDVLSSRIEELRKKHSKELHELEKMKGEIEELSRLTILPATLGVQDYDDIKEMRSNRARDISMIMDILRVARARIMIRDFEEGKMDEPDLVRELEGFGGRCLNDFAKEAISRMRTVHERKMGNAMTLDDYNKAMANFDDYILKLLDRMGQISGEVKGYCNRLVKTAKEMENMQYESEYQLERWYDRTRRGMRQIRSMDMPYEERYEREFSPEERHMLGLERRAA